MRTHRLSPAFNMIMCAAVSRVQGSVRKHEAASHVIVIQMVECRRAGWHGGTSECVVFDYLGLAARPPRTAARPSSSSFWQVLYACSTHVPRFCYFQRTIAIQPIHATCTHITSHITHTTHGFFFMKHVCGMRPTVIHIRIQRVPMQNKSTDQHNSEGSGRWSINDISASLSVGDVRTRLCAYIVPCA
jgi:hypothetical protein